jgi:hypothetical protein
MSRRLHGGAAERLGVKECDVCSIELERGTEHEMEHTNDRKMARQIALDHLAEDPDYYKHLDVLESVVKSMKASRSKRHITAEEIFREARLARVLGNLKR